VNDAAARRIVDFLNTKIKKKDAYNRVVATGGFTSPYQTYYQNKYFCEDTFQKQNVISFRTQDVDNFESLFDEIQNTVYKEMERNAPSIIQNAISYVSMSNAMPGTSDERRTELEKEAIALAFKDANAKLTALFGNKNVQNLKLINASELPPNDPMPIIQRARAPMALMSGGAAEMADSAPVQFDQQTTYKTIYFKYSFDDMGLP
jgi:uncharacterized protein YggE